MNISTYLPDDLLATVDAFASENSLSRSAIIREGLELFLARHRVDGWPELVRNWSGDAISPPMPTDLTPVEDPFTSVIRAL
jgi:predicted transcriptional regulator